MWRNYFVTAWRSLWRNKLHSLINILGLTIGVSACLVIYLIVSHELSFNRRHIGYENIYRIHSAFTGQMTGLNRGVPAAVAPAIRDQFTGVESVALAHNFNGSIKIPSITEERELRAQTAIIFTEPSYFDVFRSYKWIAGSAEVLEKPFTLVVTESEALNYFGTSDPKTVLGKEVIIRDSLSVFVAGILQDFTFSTDIDFSSIISLTTINQSWVKQNILLDDWSTINSGCQVFLKAMTGTEVEKIESQIPILARTFKDKSQWNQENKFALQPLSDFHFDSETGIFDHSRSPAHMPTLLALIVVAILLLVIGAINFINLETAQSLRRAKEVAVRKVLGSSRTKLIVQFLSQSLVVTFIAVILALPLAEFGLNIFKEFMPEGVKLELVNIAPFIVGVVLMIGVLAGLYPAFVLSSFLPAIALKSNSNASSRTASTAFLKKVLIVFQFTFAQVLILSTLVIHSQVI
jgi:ABC-type antimicrobial peptide transport system permease subunit